MRIGYFFTVLGRQKPWVSALLLSLQLSSCALLPSGEPPAPTPEEKEEAFRAQLGEQIVTEVREAIREEILPEIALLSPLPPKAHKKQISAQKEVGNRVVVGRIEWVNFHNPTFQVQARIDSGAQTCSLHAENIEEKTIDGESYVQFETKDQDDNKHVLLRKVVATRKVRNTSGRQKKRYVIREKITLGGQSFEININLNDRSKLSYRFLVGRNLLMGRYVVDVSQSRLLGRQ